MEILYNSIKHFCFGLKQMENKEEKEIKKNISDGNIWKIYQRIIDTAAELFWLKLTWT